MQVLGFDIGLRNMAAALVRLATSYSVPDHCRVYASDSETPAEFHMRAFTDFLLHGGWEVVQWRLMDVLRYASVKGDKPPRTVKDLSDVERAVATTRALDDLESAWFPEAGDLGDDPVAPDVIAVERQHNINAEMREVAFAVMTFFTRSMPSATLVPTCGNKKLKVCDALGFVKGTGLAAVAKRKQDRADKKAAKQRAADIRAAAKAASAANARRPHAFTATAAARGVVQTAKLAACSIDGAVGASHACIDLTGIGTDTDQDREQEQGKHTSFGQTCNTMPHVLWNDTQTRASTASECPAPKTKACRGLWKRSDFVRGRGGYGRWRGRGGRGGRGGSSGSGRGLAPPPPVEDTLTHADGDDAHAGRSFTLPENDNDGSDADIDDCATKAMYMDRKERALLAVERLIPPTHAMHHLLCRRGQTHDLADALLMSIYELWTRCGLPPKAPRRPRRVQVSAPAHGLPPNGVQAHPTSKRRRTNSSAEQARTHDGQSTGSLVLIV
jgi:hypothetical protein